LIRSVCPRRRGRPPGCCRPVRQQQHTAEEAGRGNENPEARAGAVASANHTGSCRQRAGIDPHKQTLSATVANPRGGIVAAEHFKMSGAGHRALEAWAREFGPIARWGIENAPAGVGTQPCFWSARAMTCAMCAPTAGRAGSGASAWQVRAPWISSGSHGDAAEPGGARGEPERADRVRARAAHGDHRAALHDPGRPSARSTGPDRRVRSRYERVPNGRALRALGRRLPRPPRIPRS
jgi:hypothetical protein